MALDCVKCPVAGFFASRNASELCVQTFCRLDFPLAETWGGQLERSGTIALGAQRCDFRWYPIRQQTIDEIDGTASRCRELMLKRTKLAGIRQPGKTGTSGSGGATKTEDPANAPVVPPPPQSDQKATA